MTKLTKEDIVNYFKELSDNIPESVRYTPDDCEGYCPFIEECRKSGGINLCDFIVDPSIV